MMDTKGSHVYTDLNASWSEELKSEQQRLFKTELIIKLLKQPDVSLSVENRALISIHQHDGSLPLGLDSIRNVELSYHDRIMLNRVLEAKILKFTQPVVEKFLELTDNNLNSLGNSTHQDYFDVLELDAEKRSLTEKLLKLKNRKIHFMNLCAEMRTGPYQRNNVETKNVESKALQIKAETIQRVMVHEIVTSTAHAQKAVKEVESNIDTLLGFK
ncbi:uncharacterized protein LOC128742379 [Sabethes cyaneus]|uniref:uncharacterized protein LOC128742379 n=1 Tax=Sabethes cyaneus TaxID=53552 RepID=UPI00237E173F|nr:uncharacterized protein LOC128742379 [Sabethes cyaneus]XP_053694698.1 uncharacterized protein LOC128742379 [Sabethes cyaneus]